VAEITVARIAAAGTACAAHDNGAGMRLAPIVIAAAIRTWIPVVMAKATDLPAHQVVVGKRFPNSRCLPLSEEVTSRFDIVGMWLVTRRSECSMSIVW
jgi:hypothetical protein